MTDEITKEEAQKQVIAICRARDKNWIAAINEVINKLEKDPNKANSIISSLYKFMENPKNG